MLRPIAFATAVAGALDILWAIILTMTVGKGDIPAMLRFVASGPFGDAAKNWEAGGAILVDDVRIPEMDTIRGPLSCRRFRHDLETYLATRGTAAPFRTLQ